LTDTVGAYDEWLTVVPDGADTARTEHVCNAGITVLLDPNVQFDIRGGFGLNDAAVDSFVGAGLSIRFPG
jgi:hypothetical protein